MFECCFQQRVSLVRCHENVQKIKWQNKRTNSDRNNYCPALMYINKDCQNHHSLKLNTNKSNSRLSQNKPLPYRHKRGNKVRFNLPVCKRAHKHVCQTNSLKVQQNCRKHQLSGAQNSLVLGPHSHMVVQVVRQMVGHQVLARHTDVHRVPVFKLPPQPLQILFRDVCLGEWRRLKEDKVPHLFGHLLRPVGKKKKKKRDKNGQGQNQRCTGLKH